ncbi:MAG TPA: methyltransferase domain-containing protein [Candidatus Thorarchaeota archaeon]|nr:MAG: methyltransferase [Candidatus Thorarchaeota archaeon]RLI56186.1 MAG: methyltransferase [Candidatus Thorarchaeota archaeon]RLI62493.1 MAG: methyltransferase [Candidatus Thorarchaeota archaeon]HDD67324.1 methyltransferase domain-containing protein [Candidatus Thorarchaeota archaeon]
MKLRDLEIALETIERRSEREVTLEDYPTPATIAAAIIYAAQMEHGDIIDKVVCDLGCGDGVFAIGAALMGARRVIGVDIQSKALKVCQRNSKLLGTDGTTDWVLGEVPSLEFRETIDTVVSNPPFGVKKRGADLVFLRKALSIARVTYSIHLAGEKNRQFLTRNVEKLGGIVTQVETFEFPIRRLFEFHRKEKHMTKVNLYRIEMKER